MGRVRWYWAFLGTFTLGTVSAGGFLLATEMKTSQWQAEVLSRFVGKMTWLVAEGGAHEMPLPHGGPYDERLGYAGLPARIKALREHGFRIERQARISDAMRDFTARGGF